MKIKYLVKFLFAILIITVVSSCGSGDSGNDDDDNNTDNTETNVISTEGLIKGTVSVGMDTENDINLWVWESSGKLVKIDEKKKSGDDYVVNLFVAPFEDVILPVLLIADTDPVLFSYVNILPDDYYDLFFNINPVVSEVAQKFLPESLSTRIIQAVETGETENELYVSPEGEELSGLTLDRFRLLGDNFISQLMKQSNAVAINFDQFWLGEYDVDTGLPDLFIQTMINWDKYSSYTSSKRVIRPTWNLPISDDPDMNLNLFENPEFQIRLGAQMILNDLTSEEVTAAVKQLEKENAQKISIVAESVRKSLEKLQDFDKTLSTFFFVKSISLPLSVKVDTQELDVETFGIIIQNSLSISTALISQMGNVDMDIVEILGNTMQNDSIYNDIKNDGVSENTIDQIVTAINEQKDILPPDAKENIIAVINEVEDNIGDGVSLGEKQAEDSDPIYMPPSPMDFLTTTTTTLETTTTSVPSTTTTTLPDDNTGSDLNTDSMTDVESETESAVESVTDTSTGFETSVKTSIETESKTGIDTASDIETNSDIETIPETETDYETQIDTGVETNSEINTETVDTSTSSDEITATDTETVDTSTVVDTSTSSDEITATDTETVDISTVVDTSTSSEEITATDTETLSTTSTEEETSTMSDTSDDTDTSTSAKPIPPFPPQPGVPYEY